MQRSIFNKYSITIACHSTHNPYLTNLKEQRHSSQPNCSSAWHEISHILWNVKVHYCVHKNPPLVPTLSQINPIHAILSYFNTGHVNFPFVWPFQRTHPSTRPCVTSQSNSYGEQPLAPHPTYKLDEQPSTLVVISTTKFSTFGAPPYKEAVSSINYLTTYHAIVTKTHFNMDSL